ncbi:MAG: BPL-N domain-containing protein [Promethearchaeota archaeon]
MKSYRPNSRVIVLSLVLVGVLVTSGFVVILSAPRPLAGVRVSVYHDNGITAASQIALTNMFLWMGAQVTTINGTDIENGALDACDILVMPGGCWCDQRCQILDEKMELVREFVENGGAYFGIDGGASYATGYRLALFQGVLNADANGSGDYLLEVNVNTASTSPDLSAEPNSYTLFYEASGYFDSENMTGIISIATYTDTGYPCMIAFQYEEGRVFLSSPHPEYEEGSTRDGTDFWDTIPDPDSEWNFMLTICQWLLE